MKKQSIASALVATAALCGAGAVHAQAAGEVMVQLGWNKIMPKVKSSDLSAPSLPGSQINIKSASALFATPVTSSRRPISSIAAISIRRGRVSYRSMTRRVASTMSDRMPSRTR